ncbi:MAG: hypothetical protein RLN72_10410 [Henriciella sp.]
MRGTEDGFEIAEADFRLRGPGDLLGVRQSGAVDYRIVDLSKDAGLIETARQDARYLIERGGGASEDRLDAIGLLKDLLSPLNRNG